MRVRLQINESDTLASVLERASEALGLRPPSDQWVPRFSHASIAFFKPEDEAGFASRHIPRYLMSELTLVDEHGTAMFGVHDLRAVRYTDLLRAAEAGTLDGDPQKPYLIIEPGYGDVPPPDWVTVIDGLKVVRDVLEYLALPGGAWASWKFLNEVRRRVGRSVEAAEGHPEWAQRGTRPYQFAALFITRPWTSSELAALLGCSSDEAEAILWAVGYSFDEEAGNWTYAGDEAAELINAIQREIQIAAHRGGDEWQVVLRGRFDSPTRNR